MKRSMKGGNVSIEANECRIFHTFVTYAHTQRERKNIHFLTVPFDHFPFIWNGLDFLISSSGTIWCSSLPIFVMIITIPLWWVEQFSLSTNPKTKTKCKIFKQKSNFWNRNKTIYFHFRIFILCHGEFRRQHMGHRGVSISIISSSPLSTLLSITAMRNRKTENKRHMWQPSIPFFFLKQIRPKPKFNCIGWQKESTSLRHFQL